MSAFLHTSKFRLSAETFSSSSLSSSRFLPSLVTLYNNLDAIDPAGSIQSCRHILALRVLRFSSQYSSLGVRHSRLGLITQRSKRNSLHTYTRILHNVRSRRRRRRDVSTAKSNLTIRSMTDRLTCTPLDLPATQLLRGRGASLRWR